MTAGGMPVLPSPGGSGALTPWGGTDAARWRPEAIAANATSAALNAAWARTDLKDAIVAFPAKMLQSPFFQFGDGQANAAEAEHQVSASEPCTDTQLVLPAETNLGSWDNLGDPGEPFGGTNSAVLLPDGRVMMCHDTRDPVLFDPVARTAESALASPGLQGCHAVAVMPNGRVIYVGGANVPVYGPGTRTVKSYDPVADTWQVQPNMNGYRWYPTMTTLPDGRLLTIGGGNEFNPQRSKSAEVMDPTTMMWTPVGDVALGNEISPILVLPNGDVLMTHRPPQLFSSTTLTWRSAMDFVQGNRMPNGDHADHELHLLPDGRVAAIGYKSFTSGQIGRILEIYDPTTGTWALGAESTPVRSRANTVMMPDGRILVIGGFVEDASDPAPRNAWGQTNLVDAWDPRRDAWRRLTSIEVAREYHAMPVVLPDGRIFVAGGEGQPGNEPSASVAEVFSPPYLTRGPRPRIGAIMETELRRGAPLSIDLAGDEKVTEVIMMGTNATTHFMESGNARYESLAFAQTGARIIATVPSEPGRAIPGWYLVFVLVDDIPSVARVMRLTL